MTRSLALLLPLLAVAALWLAGPTSSARAETRVVESTVENAYPGDLIFHLKATADVNITGVSLILTYGRAGTSALRQPDDFAPATAIEILVTVDVTRGNTEIPVATDISYSWEIKTADGQVFVTPPEEFTYLPPNREWQQIESGAIRIYYHGDRERAAREILIAGQDAYDTMAIDLLKTELEVVPVRVVMFVTEDEMNAAQEGRSTTLDDFTQTCGLKVSTDVVYVIQTCSSISTAEILRHELTHIIVEAAGEGPFSIMPAWLNEGTAVYAQTTPGDGFENAFKSAARTGRFLPFADVALPASDPRDTNLFYGQSWGMVRFLIERNGPDDFAELFSLMKAGTRYDRAIEQIYGFDLAGFEKAFIAGVSQQQQSPTPAPTRTPGQARPTDIIPTRVPISTSNTQDSNGGDDGLNVAAIAIVAIAVLFGLLAVFAYLLSSMLGSNRRAAEPRRQATAGPDDSPPDGDAWERPAPPPPPGGESLLRPSNAEPPETDQPPG